jgi:hypothetical protein
LIYAILTTIEKRSKHCDDLVNAKLIPSVLSDYISPLPGVVNRDNVPRDFEFTLIDVGGKIPHRLALRVR